MSSKEAQGERLEPPQAFQQRNAMLYVIYEAQAWAVMKIYSSYQSHRLACSGAIIVRYLLRFLHQNRKPVSVTNRVNCSVTHFMSQNTYSCSMLDMNAFEI